MSLLTICTGLPGSGKTTFAKEWVSEDPTSRARVNRDDFRFMLHNSVYLAHDTERQIVRVRDASITALLLLGIDVVSDDTNLPDHVIHELARLATDVGADWKVQSFTHIPLEVCIARNGARVGPSRIPDPVIIEMHQRYIGRVGSDA